MSGSSGHEAASERTAVYRIYGADSELLYVGITKDFGARWAQHAAKQPWWPEVARQTVDWHESREAALAEEARAIKAEGPRHNSWRTAGVNKSVPSEQAVGQRFKELRVAIGLSQTDAATHMAQRGWPWYQSTVWRIESVAQPLRVGELIDLAAILGVPPGRLLEEAPLVGVADERKRMERAIREQIAAEIAADRPEAA